MKVLYHGNDGALFGKQTQKGTADNYFAETMEWSISVPLFRNTVILKQLGLAIGIPFGALIIVLLILSFSDVGALYGLALVGALLVLSWLFLMIVYRGKYEMDFLLDSDGALYRTQAKQAKKNWIINTLAVVFGLLFRNPTAAGAGMLAQSRQQVFMRWERITRVKYIPRSRTILLRSGLMENIALFCSEENYFAAEHFVKNKTQHLRG